MTLQDQNKAVTIIIHLIVLNNAGGVARALNKEGYESKDYIRAPELEKALLQLYIADSARFFEIMKTISWNYGHIETNKPEIKDELIKLVVSNTEHEVSKDTWWQDLIALICSAIPVEKNERIQNKNYGIGFLLVLAFIGLIIALIIIFRS